MALKYEKLKNYFPLLGKYILRYASVRTNFIIDLPKQLKKQSARSVLSKRYSWKFRKIHRKTAVSESLF